VICRGCELFYFILFYLFFRHFPPPRKKYVAPKLDLRLQTLGPLKLATQATLFATGIRKKTAADVAAEEQERKAYSA
jgi:hypothetical protein